MTTDSPLEQKLEQARRDLLDLSNRNRLLSTPRTTTRSSRLEIVDELTGQVFRILVDQNKSMTFLPTKNEDEDTGADTLPDGQLPLFQPADDDDEPAERHVDSKLQTKLNSNKLQTRLLKLHRDARTFEEEQGVNSLFLALGFLKWFEDDKSSRERYAPLILVPVTLDRKNANARFHLQYTEDEIVTNLSLKEKLKVDFGILLPELNTDDDNDISPVDYFKSVEKAISAKGRWEVLSNDMVLWFFSFSKFLMYIDLHPDFWPDGRNITEHGIIDGLLHGGFESVDISGNDQSIDRILQPLDMTHIMDADSSQTMAIEEVRRGNHLVIQGPPGTGKSQTITNLIAAAVKDGKKVLFVAEKMAALEVVKRRLDSVALGGLCLELHSHKANKKAVLEGLQRTLSLGRPKTDGIEAQASELLAVRDRLNQHVKFMHARIRPTNVTPYQLIGKLVTLTANGVPSSDFTLPDALSWSNDDIRNRINQLDELSVHLREIGCPSDHPWRGVRHRSLIPSDVNRIMSSIPDIKSRVDQLKGATDELAELLRFEPTETPMDSSTVAIYANQLVKVPELDRQAIASSAWKNQQSRIAELVSTGMSFFELKKQYCNTFADVAWTTDVAEARRNLAAYGRSWFRIFNGKYRSAKATLRGIVSEPIPKSNDEQLAMIDGLIKMQKLQRDVAENATLGEHAFGTLWRKEDSDWNSLSAIVQWESDCREAAVPESFRELLAELEDVGAISDILGRVRANLKPMLSEIQQLISQLDLDISDAFGVRDARVLPLKTLSEHLKRWQDHPESLSKWMAYFSRWSSLSELGLEELSVKIDQGTVAPDDTSSYFKMAYYEELIRAVFAKCSDIAEFDGASHETILEEFKKLDCQRLQLAVAEVALAHYQGLPSGSGGAGEMKILRHEMKKKRRHMSIRRLLTEAGHAVQAIKPVFMMSPISVAQFLQPGGLEFDLLLIDEASQVEPVDALGAIARANQIVVVGDDKQLPPTNFFGRVAGDEDDDDNSVEFQTGNLESILSLCEAQGVPQRMLEWHYRSRHQSLIAVSNHEFYDDGLFVVPSPMLDGGDLGLRFHLISEGTFDRGGSATNRIEAQAVADAVMDHARERPDKSLGVGAFSIKQRDVILDELEFRRRQFPDCESFFLDNGSEPFFVKNLENIQGDERDVIFISIGFAKSPAGSMTMNFGPLSRDGGHRRLNVLITRAKERCEVFSSITADAIDLSRAKGSGPKALKTFLTYCQHGRIGFAETTDRDFDSDFEIEVCRAIEAYGHELRTQVGDAGFFVDLAVVDPDTPGRYLLGIECDGATYHSSRSARDRDRLRQQILEDRGWVIHRIWSTDWFKRPKEQLTKVLHAIEEAKVKWAGRSTTPIETHEKEGISHVLERETEDLATAQEEPTIKTEVYIEADFAVDASVAIHEVSLPYLEKVVTKIVEIEGPVHQEEITRRVVSLWGLKRTGARISQAVDAALSEACYKEGVKQDGLFFMQTSSQHVPIRNRGGVTSTGLKKPEHISSIELRTAISAVITSHLGIPEGEIAIETGRLLGFRSTSAQFKQAVQDEVDYLVRNVGAVEIRNEKAFVINTADHIDAAD